MPNSDILGSYNHGGGKTSEMGSTVSASCMCGYTEDNIHIGGGMIDFGKYYGFPYYCKSCKQMVTANALDEHPACSECESKDILPYTHPDIVKRIGVKQVPNWEFSDTSEQLVLTNGDYLCPSCGEFHLTFRDGDLLWD